MGIKGITQGEKKDSNPSKNTRIKLILSEGVSPCIWLTSLYWGIKIV
jgi:hypothetical protein